MHFRGFATSYVSSGTLLPHRKSDTELQHGHGAVAELEIGEEAVFVREAERVERAAMCARLIELPQEHHRRSAALVHAPRSADRKVIEEFDVESGEGEIAAEAAIDARPEPEILKQLGCFEVRAEEPLFRVNRGAALEADALRFGAAVYQKKDSNGGKTDEKSSWKEDKSTHQR